MPCFTVCFRKKAAPPPKRTIDIEEEVSGIQNIRLYSYKELQLASNGFNVANKIGEGGFGSVYKGRLKDGTLVAIKVLSTESSQGVREFLTELTTIAGLEHENLAKLYGCCVEGVQRILVYGYLENKSLGQTLLGRGPSNIKFSWKTRTNICIGVARGLAFLHEDVHPHIVHRDIKATNILLDKDLTAKISDFGLAKLFPSHLTHISTRVAGTLGYLAPEYAIQGRLTRKADIYSFGVLLLEIVCGRYNKNSRLPLEEKFLLQRAWDLYEKGNLVNLVDTSLEGQFNADEAIKYMQISFLCTQDAAKNRPSMSAVVKMLTGEMDVDEKNISRPSLQSELPGKKFTSNASSDSLGKHNDSSSSSNINMTYGTLTFTSIADRSK